MPLQTPLFVAARGGSLDQAPLRRILFGKWGGEDVVVCRLGEDTTEIHCHGGHAAVERIVSDLVARGCEQAEPFELIAQTIGRFESECQFALSRACTERTALLLLEQIVAPFEANLSSSEGRFERAISKLIDVPDVAHIDALLQWAEFGKHLTRPWTVAIIGRPNVGKSSLINRLLGYGRAIVSPQAGTTRDVLIAHTAFDGWPIELLDTAGIRETSSTLEAAGIARALAAVAASDLAIVVLDRSEPFAEEDAALLRAVEIARTTSRREPLVVANKCDLKAANGYSPVKASAIPVSCHTGAGLEELMRAVVERLIPESPPVGIAVPFCDRHVDSLQAARSAAMANDDFSADASLSEILGYDAVDFGIKRGGGHAVE